MSEIDEPMAAIAQSLEVIRDEVLKIAVHLRLAVQAAQAAQQQIYPQDVIPKLSKSEHRVLNLVVLEGLSNKVIAERVGVAESMVKGTLQRLFGKMAVRTRGQLVRVAMEKGICAAIQRKSTAPDGKSGAAAI